jgi:phage repressor protein C with HTH and peptisase S24 domain
MIALEEVILWLFKFETSKIGADVHQLISKMQSEFTNNHKNNARALQQKLLFLAKNVRDGNEATEILVECGINASNMGDQNESEGILMDAIARAWSELHARAVIQCLLGCVLWKSPESRSRALVTWRNAISDFGKLAEQPEFSPERRSWYQDMFSQLEGNLIEATSIMGEYNEEEILRGTDEPSNVEEMESSVQSQEVAVAPSPDTAIQTLSSDILQLFTISEEIPAGDFGPSGVDPFPIGAVEVDRLSINSRSYSIYNTRGKKIVNLPLDQQITVVKVKGDSMDLENINSGDYVLMRRVDMPVNGDIVLAEVVGTDSSATLKKYFKDKDTITLEPHSSNPSHQPFVFNKGNKGFHIRGVVIAVLKPI